MTVPVVQYLLLRKELPYKTYLSYVAVYGIIGGIMLVCVRLISHLLPAETWLNLGIETLAGAVIYTALCLAWWKISGKDHLKLLKRRS